MILDNQDLAKKNSFLKEEMSDFEDLTVKQSRETYESH